jgi:hypothetical protein
MTYKTGDRYRLLPNATYSRGVSETEGAVAGDEVTVRANGLDVDGDVRIMANGVRTYARPEFLEPLGAPASAQGNRVTNSFPTRVTATEAFALEGNEIEFTVVADENATHYTVGCKTARKTTVLPLIYKLDKEEGAANQVALTFRAIVKDGKIGTDEVSIDRYDLDSYGQGIRIISFQEEVKPDVTVTLTHAQAEAIGAMKGRIGGKESGSRGHACEGMAVINTALGYASYDDNPRSGNISRGLLFTD